MVRVIDYFETQIRVPTAGKSKKMTNDQTINWFNKVLEGVRLRYRKLLRFTRSFLPFFSNAFVSFQFAGHSINCSLTRQSTA